MTAETNRMKKDSSPCLGRVQPMGDSPDRNNLEGSKPHQDPKIASLQGNILRLTEANKWLKIKWLPRDCYKSEHFRHLEPGFPMSTQFSVMGLWGTTGILPNPPSYLAQRNIFPDWGWISSSPNWHQSRTLRVQPPYCPAAPTLEN